MGNGGYPGHAAKHLAHFDDKVVGVVLVQKHHPFDAGLVAQSFAADGA